MALPLGELAAVRNEPLTERGSDGNTAAEKQFYPLCPVCTLDTSPKGRGKSLCKLATFYKEIVTAFHASR